MRRLNAPDRAGSDDEDEGFGFHHQVQIETALREEEELSDDEI